MRSYDKELMENAVAFLQQYITVRLYSEQTIDRNMVSAAKVMGLLAKVNDKKMLLSISAFYNDGINDELDMLNDYGSLPPAFLIPFSHHRLTALALCAAAGRRGASSPSAATRPTSWILQPRRRSCSWMRPCRCGALLSSL